MPEKERGKELNRPTKYYRALLSTYDATATNFLHFVIHCVDCPQECMCRCLDLRKILSHQRRRCMAIRSRNSASARDTLRVLTSDRKAKRSISSLYVAHVENVAQRGRSALSNAKWTVATAAQQLPPAAAPLLR